MMNGMGGMMGCGAMALLWLVFAVLLVAGVVVLVRALIDRGAGTGSGGSSAMEILEGRFARGATDRDEFEERRRALQS